MRFPYVPPSVVPSSRRTSSTATSREPVKPVVASTTHGSPTAMRVPVGYYVRAGRTCIALPSMQFACTSGIDPTHTASRMKAPGLRVPWTGPAVARKRTMMRLISVPAITSLTPSPSTSSVVTDRPSPTPSSTYTPASWPPLPGRS